MPVLKRLNNLPFTAVSNQVVDALSIEALGSLVKMLKLPPDFEFNVTMLQKRLGVGRAKLNAITNELKDVEVLRISSVRSDDGTRLDGWEWLVSPLPMESVKDVTFQTSTKSEVLNFRSSELQDENIKESLKIKESIKNKKSLIREGTRLPDDWSPTAEQIAWAKENTPKVDIAYEAFRFLEYWTNKTGKAAEKLDWNMTWQVWMRTAHMRLKSGRSYQPRKTAAEQTAEAFERSIAKEREKIANANRDDS